MIGCYQGDRLWLQIAPPFIGAAVQQHLRETRVVRDGADHTRAARLPAPPLHRVTDPGNGTDKAILRHRLGDQSPLVLIGDEECRVGHPQWIEQPLPLELKQRLPRDDLDDAPEYVGGMTVIPQRSRLLRQRQLRDALDKFGVVGIAIEQIGLRIELAHGAVAVEAVGQTRRMPQQIFDGDSAANGLQRKRLPALI